MEYSSQDPYEINVMRNAQVEFKHLYDHLDAAIPESAEKTLALRELQKCRMMFNAAVVLNGLE